MDIQTGKKVAEALGVKELLPEVYRDLAQPAARVAGEKLYVVANALGKAFDPLEGLVWGYDRIKEWMCSKVLEKIANEDPANIQSPKLSVAGPIITNMHFAYEEEHLKEMYANLLAAAMHKKKADLVHPLYVHVLQQLSPDEALILKQIRHLYSMNHESRIFTEMQGSKIRFPAFQKICRNAGLVHSEIDFAKYCDNMLRLKILNVHSDIYRSIDMSTRRDYTPYFSGNIEEMIEITEFGLDLIELCVE